MTSIHIFVRWFCSLSNCTTCAGHCVLQLHTSAPTTATLKWTDHTTGQRQSKTSATEGSPRWGLRKKRRMKARRSQKDGSSKRYMVTIGLLSAPTSQWEWTTSQVHLQRPQMHSLMTLHLASPLVLPQNDNRSPTTTLSNSNKKCNEFMCFMVHLHNILTKPIDSMTKLWVVSPHKGALYHHFDRVSHNAHLLINTLYGLPSMF